MRPRKPETRPAWSSGWGNRLGDQPPRCERDHLIQQAIGSSRRNSVSSQVTVESDATEYARLRSDLESINFPAGAVQARVASGDRVQKSSFKVAHAGGKSSTLVKPKRGRVSKSNGFDTGTAHVYCEMTLPMSGAMAARNNESPFRCTGTVEPRLLSILVFSPI